MGSEMGEMLPAASPVGAIDDEILSEILLRLPPQPSSLPRASAVCKRWHSIACNPDFCRRFRRHHRRKAPLLGFFDPNEFLEFEPTLDAPNRVSGLSLWSNDDDNEDHYWAADSRHGLVLIFDDGPHQILVWDPVTGNMDCIPIPQEFEEAYPINGAVLRDAGDVHFRVVLVMPNTGCPEHIQAFACVYSSEASLWGELIPTPLPPEACECCEVITETPAVLAGESLYWVLNESLTAVLEFNLERQSLDVIGLPAHIKSSYSLVTVEEGGGLGLLRVPILTFTAELWKRKINCHGIASWVLGRTIELDKLLSLNRAEHQRIFIQGFAEENNLVFLGTVIGLFLLHLPSLDFTFMKDTKCALTLCMPFESVYTAETRTNEPKDLDLSEQEIGSPE